MIDLGTEDPPIPVSRHQKGLRKKLEISATKSQVMITQQLPSRKSIWFSKFLNKKETVLTAGEQRRLSLENERRGYSPKFVEKSSVTRFVDRERELEMVPFIAGVHGPRCS